MMIVKRGLFSATLNGIKIIQHFLWVSRCNKPNLDARRMLFFSSLKLLASVSYAGIFHAVFIDFASKGFSNSVAFYFRKMQNNLLSMENVPLNAFDGLRNLKEM